MLPDNLRQMRYHDRKRIDDCVASHFRFGLLGLGYPRGRQAKGRLNAFDSLKRGTGRSRVHRQQLSRVDLSRGDLNSSQLHSVRTRLELHVVPDPDSRDK